MEKYSTVGFGKNDPSSQAPTRTMGRTKIRVNVAAISKIGLVVTDPYISPNIKPTLAISIGPIEVI